jgi:hypothetical protein
VLPAAYVTHCVEVTSATADSYGYPARIVTFDGSSWARTYEACRAVKIGGGSLTTGYYLGRLVRADPSGMHVYAVEPIVASTPGTVGLKGQANSLPTPTPEGPRATANLIPYSPAIGDNFAITLVDDGANDRLNWTLNNLGLFVRDTANFQVGPRRQLHFLPDAVGVVRIVVADDAGNDEVEVAVDLDPPGLPYAVLWTDSGGNVIAWTDDPEVVRLTARSEIVIGVPSDTTGILKFKDEFSSRSFDIQASGQGASQNLNLPQSLPTVRQFLQAYQVSGADVQAKWVGLGLSTQSIAGLTVVASIDNWEQIRFSNEFFEVFGNDAGTPANSTYGVVNLKKGLWVGIATSDLEMRGYDVYMNDGTGTGGGDAYMDGGYVYMCDGTGTGGGDFYMDGGNIWMHAGGIAFGNGGFIYAGAGAPAYPSIDPYNRQLWGGASHVSLTWNNDGISMGGKRIEMNTGGGTGGGDIYMDGGKIKFATGDIVDQAAARADSTAATLADLVTDFNDLLAKLRTAGIIKT